MEMINLVGFGMMDGYGYGMMGYGGMFFGLLFWIIIIVLEAVLKFKSILQLDNKYVLC